MLGHQVRAQFRLGPRRGLHAREAHFHLPKAASPRIRPAPIPSWNGCADLVTGMRGAQTQAVDI